MAIALPETYFGNYAPWTFGWTQDPPIVFEYDGVPFPAGVHPLAAPIFAAILRELLPHLPKPDDGSSPLMNPGCWGYDGGSLTVGGSPSFHTYGLAVDVNAPVNPMISSGWAAHEMPDIAGGIAARYGGEWGGGWTSPVDYMHIELHLSPAGALYVAAQIAADNPSTPAPQPRVPEDDTMYILNEKTKGDPSSVRMAILSGPMFVGLGGEEVRHANAMIASGRALYQWVETQTWEDFDRRSHALCGI